MTGPFVEIDEIYIEKGLGDEVVGYDHVIVALRSERPQSLSTNHFKIPKENLRESAKRILSDLDED
jgi:hypothetical protein